jgi:hypothetical protein
MFLSPAPANKSEGKQENECKSKAPDQRSSKRCGLANFFLPQASSMKFPGPLAAQSYCSTVPSLIIMFYNNN